MDPEYDIKQVPATYRDEHAGSDGFDQPGDQSGNTIIGLMEKFVDGDWTTGGLPSDPKRRLVAVAVDTILQRWQEQRVIETIGEKPLPNVDELNEATDRNTWELDLNNNPRPPWQRAHIVYFLDLDNAERSTFVSATTGAAIAVSRLKDKTHWMRRMRGTNVVAQIELTWAPMQTRFGMRKRPDFKVVGWVDFTAGGSTLPPTSGPKQLPPVEPKQVEEPSTAENLNDSIRF
jgi:hypothetical protein